MLVETLLLLSLGIGTGLVGGAFGVGGGFILVPVFHTVFRWPILESVAASQFCVLAASVSAGQRYMASGFCDLRLGTLLEASTMLGAAVGASIAVYLLEPLVAGVFAFVAMLAAWRMWLLSAHSRVDRVTPSRAARLPLGILASTFAGGLAGILGVGGGIFKVPLLTDIMRVPPRRAAGTSAFMIGLTAATSAIIYYGRGRLPVREAAVVALGVLAGSYIGARIRTRLSSVPFQRAFSILLAILALRMASRALGW